MEKIIFEIERQIQRLQAAKQFLIETRDSTSSIEAIGERITLATPPPVKRGRGRPRKYPLVSPPANSPESSTA